MSHLNLNLSAALEQKLRRYMRARGIKTKADAVRTAIDEALQSVPKTPPVRLRNLVGAAKDLPQRPRKKWLSEDDLWEPDGR